MHQEICSSNPRGWHLSILQSRESRFTFIVKLREGCTFLGLSIIRPNMEKTTLRTLLVDAYDTGSNSNLWITNYLAGGLNFLHMPPDLWIKKFFLKESKKKTFLSCYMYKFRVSPWDQHDLKRKNFGKHKIGVALDWRTCSHAKVLGNIHLRSENFFCLFLSNSLTGLIFPYQTCVISY